MPRPSPGWWRLDATDREVATTWIATRVGVLVLALAGAWMLGTGAHPHGFLHGWDNWDADIFTSIARYGYRGAEAHTGYRHLAAFFPGQPAALWLVHQLVRSWVASGLVLSAAAGSVAMVALGRLGAVYAGPPAGNSVVGQRAALYLILSPYAVFLAAGYSEALFLAFALPAWLAAKRGNWVAAGLLAGAAASLRIDGLFLGVALVVEWLCTGGWRQIRNGWALLAPWLVTAGYFVYLHSIRLDGVKGDWLAWSHAQRDGWGRKLTNPWTAFHTTWEAARSSYQGVAYEWSWRAEIAAVLLGLLLTVVLLVLRRWGEATFIGIQVVAFATSSYYLSVARSTLLWFPLWLLLARWSSTRRWLHVSYLAIGPALMAVGVVAFTSGRWVG